MRIWIDPNLVLSTTIYILINLPKNLNILSLEIKSKNSLEILKKITMSALTITRIVKYRQTCSNGIGILHYLLIIILVIYFSNY